jgi:hypothetical protein
VNNGSATGSSNMNAGQVLGIDHMASTRSGRSVTETIDAITPPT